MAIVCQRVTHVTKFAGRLALAIKPCIGIGLRLVCFVVPLTTLEACFAAAIVAIAAVFIVLAHKLLCPAQAWISVPSTLKCCYLKSGGFVMLMWIANWAARHAPTPEKQAERALDEPRMELFRAEQQVLDAQLRAEYYRTRLIFLEEVT